MCRFLALLVLAASVLNLAQKVQGASTQDYIEHARNAIETLNKEWYDAQTGIWDNAWWNSANVLTTLADFAVVAPKEAESLELHSLFRNTFVQAQKENVQTRKFLIEGGMVSTTDCLGTGGECRFSSFGRNFKNFINDFYDDEGWWALGLIRIYDVTGDSKYLDAAMRIFKDMQTGLGGPCDGGIYWNKERKYVNAITNELYLSVAASLANRTPNGETFLQIANDQWTWFKNSGMINKDGLVNDGLDGKCKNNGLPTWSYNQGVILGGLAELFKASNNVALLGEAYTIAKAGIDHLANEDGVIIETDKCETQAGHCGRDGQQFKGVFIRNLGYLYEVAPLDQYREVILTNADSIWENSRNDLGVLGVAWNGPFVVSSGAAHSSALDALVAAIAVS